MTTLAEVNEARARFDHYCHLSSAGYHTLKSITGDTMVILDYLDNMPKPKAVEDGMADAWKAWVAKERITIEKAFGGRVEYIFNRHIEQSRPIWEDAWRAART